MDHLKEAGISLLRHYRVNPIHDAVMFDIDSTLIFPNGDANKPIIELAREAHNMNYNVVIITARPHWMEYVTRHELMRYGIPYDILKLCDYDMKGDMKKLLGYNFVLSVGDIWEDLTETKHWINVTTHQYL
jgi:hypothetical protein|tara:strand:+ start:8056 stop:8448 length:393 start_codon:yes stop_codon:yes gene_type:complete